MAGGDIDEHLAWLEKRRPPSDGFSLADMNTLKALGLKPPQKG
jgi:hypothetical protein